MSAKPAETFQQWAILELMGHVKLAGIVTEEERFGTKMGRIDIPDGNGGFTTQYFGGSSVYRMTPTTEEIARHIAEDNQPTPVHPWQLRQLTSAAAPVDPDDVDRECVDDDEDVDDDSGQW